MLAPDEQRFELDELRYSLASDIVELVILTSDESFLATLREAVGSTRRLWHVPSADKVSDLLVAGEVGILVLDESALMQSAERFVSDIKRQFPDLVIVVAGNREAEAGLAALISSGAIYRFIHKPMSPGRAKLFADAAVKRYGEQRRRATTPHAPPARRRLPRAALPAAIAIGCACLVGSYLAFRHAGQSERVDDTLSAASLRLPAPESPLIAQAQAALAANRLTSPSEDNALELYSQALRGNPQDAAAHAGLLEVHERLLARAENALLEERLAEAASAIDIARSAGVDGKRVTFLTTQLAQARERQRTAGEPTEAQPAAAVEPVVRPERVGRFLALASQRRLAGQLLSPEHDSARYYVLEAARFEPNADSVADAKQALALALLAAARGAIDRRDFGRAEAALNGADGIAAPANIDSVRQLLGAARLQADAAAREQLAKNAEERLQQDRLIEPANDNAKYYILTLRALEPGNAALVGLIQDLGVRLTAKARRALTLEQYPAARSWLDEVGGIGYSSGDMQQVARDLDVAVARQKFMGDVVAANDLALVKSVQPTYPAAAQRAHAEGWVELDFTVAADGSVDDIGIRAANPPGVFDAAAIAALSQWTYRPVTRDGKAAAQRARIRIRFTLAG